MISLNENNGGSEGNNNSGDHLVSVKQVAKILGISRRHLERLVCKGVFPRPVKLGRASRFMWSDVEAFMHKLNDERQKGGEA